jgi:hypothetical protein
MINSYVTNVRIQWPMKWFSLKPGAQVNSDRYVRITFIK